MNRFRQLIFCCILCAFSAVSAETAAPAFRFGGRTFSSAEAAKIAALPAPETLSENASVRQKIEAQREIVSGIALFAREGIELSAQDAMMELGGELLLMPETAKAVLARELQSRNISQETFLLQESQTLQRQFAAAAHKWYRKNFANLDKITETQIRDWYFRHQDRFLVEKIDREKCFMLADRKTAESVLAMLRQGTDAAAIRAAVKTRAIPEELPSWLKSQNVRHETPAPGYTLHFDEYSFFLMPDSALKRSYRKLDKPLHDAIEAALYDALARARLDAALQEEMRNAEFEFPD